jgi:hypothetical protein
VLEVARVRSTLIHCLAAEETVGQISQLEGVLAARIAPDETLVVGPPDAAAAMLEQLIGIVRPLDSTSLILDQSAGYAGFCLSGDSETAAFARLSQLSLGNRRPVFMQGLVTRASAKVLAADDSIIFFVSSVVDHVVADRITTACAELDVAWQPAVDFAVPAGWNVER